MPSPFSLISNDSVENKTGGPFSMACGTFEQLEYWPNNFDDFAVSCPEAFGNLVLTSSQNAMIRAVWGICSQSIWPDLLGL